MKLLAENNPNQNIMIDRELQVLYSRYMCYTTSQNSLLAFLKIQVQFVFSDPET